MENGKREKESNEIWWRWFFVSNWSSLMHCKRSDARKQIAHFCAWYPADSDFWKKAQIEIIDGDTHQVFPLSDLKSLAFDEQGKRLAK